MIVSLIQGTAHFSNIKNKGKIKSSIRFLLAQRYFFVRDFSPGEVGNTVLVSKWLAALVASANTIVCIQSGHFYFLRVSAWTTFLKNSPELQKEIHWDMK